MPRLKPLAPDLNAFTLGFDETLLDELKAMYRQEIEPFFSQPRHQHLLQGGRTRRRAVGTKHYLFSYDTYPLLWISNHHNTSFAIYQRFFERLQLEQALQSRIDHHKEIVMYCGFLVLGNQAPETLWHDDYLQGANAYTLITPLFELAPEHGQLLYEQHPDQEAARYVYSPGEAIILGDSFLHSTEPYAPSPHLRVLVSLTFGTDKWAHWPQLKQALNAQSKYFRLPCGHLNGKCFCQIKYLIKKIFKAQK